MNKSQIFLRFLSHHFHLSLILHFIDCLLYPLQFLLSWLPFLSLSLLLSLEITVQSWVPLNTDCLPFLIISLFPLHSSDKPYLFGSYTYQIRIWISIRTLICYFSWSVPNRLAFIPIWSCRFQILVFNYDLAEDYYYFYISETWFL